MQWNSIYWTLVVSAMIGSSAAERSRHKRSLSFLNNLFWNVIGRSQEDCTQSHHKSPKQYEIYILPDDENLYFKTSKNYNGGNFYMKSIRQFLASDRHQETSDPLRGDITSLKHKNLISEGTVKQNTLERPRYVSGQKLTLDSKSTFTVIPKNPVTIEKNDNNNHQIITMPTVTSFISPLITMPRKYSYEQIRGKGVQTFFLDKNSDVQVTETTSRLSRPVYVEDRIRDVILSVPSFLQRGYQKNFNKLYEEVILKPNVEEEVKNDQVTYTGEPIVVSDDATMKLNASVLSEENEINKIVERGDIR